MKPSYFALLLLLLPSVTLSQTLCRKGEVDYFSCKTSSEKLISVCGNITNDEINDSSWLQYRFGKTGEIELTYPKEKENSISKFEGNYFNKYDVVDLRFINGNTLYSVDLNGPYSGDDSTNRTEYTGGVSVQIGKTKRVNFFCRKIDGLKYFSIFSGLNVSLRNYSGETDFLYNFHKLVAK